MTNVITEFHLNPINMIKKFYLNPCYFDMWAHQNKVEYISYIEGVLLDNYLVMTKHGLAAIYEHYVNPNRSTYEVHFMREYKDVPGWTQIVCKEWYDFEDRNIEERR